MKTLAQLRAEQQSAGLTPPPPDHGDEGVLGPQDIPGPARPSGRDVRGLPEQGFCKIVGGQGDAFLRVEGQSAHPDFHANLKKVS